MASVSLRDITKSFVGAATPALRDLTLDVPDGELLVLLGPSGSGKTTALRCIAGLEEPSAGEIVIGDRVVTHLPAAARDVAMVFQHYALYPHLTARGNLAFALEVRGLARAEIDARVTDTATRLGITHALDRFPAQLSGGERQRVALGRAVARAPQAFLLDEPLASLDAPLRAELRGELLAVHRALGQTMLYVTHDQIEAMTLGQRIAVMDQGRIRQVGTPIEVYERPADAFVARFVGNPGMNVLPGRARASADGPGAVDAGSLTLPMDLATYEGELQLGVRPEHVGLSGVDQGVGNADVLVVEPRGSETLVHLHAGGQTLVARLPGFVDVRVGTRVGVKVDRKRLHFFDAAGARIA